MHDNGRCTLNFECILLQVFDTSPKFNVSHSIETNSSQGVEYGLKASVPYRSIGWLQRVTWKKNRVRLKKYRTPSKLQNEIKKNFCCLKV